MPQLGDRVLETPVELKLEDQGPRVVRHGRDITLVGSGYATQLCRDAALRLMTEGIDAEVIDLRVLNPFDAAPVVASVAKTGRLCVVDDGWRPCGMAGEVIAATVERVPPSRLKSAPSRITLPDAPAPTSRPLETAYYPTAAEVVETARQMLARA